MKRIIAAAGTLAFAASVLLAPVASAAPFHESNYKKIALASHGKVALASHKVALRTEAWY